MVAYTATMNLKYTENMKLKAEIQDMQKVDKQAILKLLLKVDKQAILELLLEINIKKTSIMLFKKENL